MIDYYYFLIEGYGQPVGYIHKIFVDQMRDIWSNVQGWDVNHEERHVKLNAGRTFEERSAVVERTLRNAVDSEKLRNCEYGRTSHSES